MKAAVVERYGPPEVVSVRDLPDPVAKGQRRSCASALRPSTSGDARIRGARFPRGFAVPGRLALGLRAARQAGPRRRLLGVGRVARRRRHAAWPSATRWRDDRHRGWARTPSSRPSAPTASCAMPAGVSHDDAAAVLFGGSTARHFLARPGRRPGPARAGERRVRRGRHGGRAARARWPAPHVTGVCSAAQRRARALASGPTKSSTTRRTSVRDRRPSATTWCSTPSATSDRRLGRRLLAPGGVLLLAAAELADTVLARGNVRAGPAAEDPAHFAWLLDRLAAGELRPCRPHAAAGRDRRGSPRRRLRPQGRQPRRHAMTRRAAAAVPGVGHQRAIAADWPSVHVELHTQ